MENFAVSLQLSLKRKVTPLQLLVLDLQCDSDSGRDSMSDSDSDDSVAEETSSILGPEGYKSLYVLINLPNIINLEGSGILAENGSCVRTGNVRRNRELILGWSNTIEDSMFIRQFRLCREDFYNVLQNIKPLLRKNVQQAQNSYTTTYAVDHLTYSRWCIVFGYDPLPCSY